MRIVGCMMAMLFGLGGCAKTVEVTALTVDSIEQIEIFPSSWRGPGAPPREFLIKEPAQIAKLLPLLQPIGETSRSAIVDRAKMTVMQKTGQKILLRFQPGNDPQYYEYAGQGRAFLIPREPFLTGLNELGITWFPIDP